MSSRQQYTFVVDYVHVACAAWSGYFLATVARAALPIQPSDGLLLTSCVAAGVAFAALQRRHRESSWLAFSCGVGASMLSLLPIFAMWSGPFSVAVTHGLLTSPALVVAVEHARRRELWKTGIVVAGLAVVLSLPLSTESVWDAWIHGKDIEFLMAGVPMGALAASAVWAISRRNSPCCQKLAMPRWLIVWVAPLVLGIGWLSSAQGVAGWSFAVVVSFAVVTMQGAIVGQIGIWRTAAAVVGTIALLIALQAASQWLVIS